MSPQKSMQVYLWIKLYQKILSVQPNAAQIRPQKYRCQCKSTFTVYIGLLKCCERAACDCRLLQDSSEKFWLPPFFKLFHFCLSTVWVPEISPPPLKTNAVKRFFQPSLIRLNSQFSIEVKFKTKNGLIICLVWPPFSWLTSLNRIFRCASIS